eukprot:902911-Rhodomonas_salina.1
MHPRDVGARRRKVGCKSAVIGSSYDPLCEGIPMPKTKIEWENESCKLRGVACLFVLVRASGARKCEVSQAYS